MAIIFAFARQRGLRSNSKGKFLRKLPRTPKIIKKLQKHTLILIIFPCACVFLASIPSSFLHMLGEHFGGTVQISAGSGALAGQVRGKNRCNDSRRELNLPRLQRKKDSIPSCFLTLLGDKTSGTVQNCHRALQAIGDAGVEVRTVAGMPTAIG